MLRRRGRGAAPHGCGCYRECAGRPDCSFQRPSSPPARRALAADLFPLEQLTYAEQLDAIAHRLALETGYPEPWLRAGLYGAAFLGRDKGLRA